MDSCGDRIDRRVSHGMRQLGGRLFLIHFLKEQLCCNLALCGSMTLCFFRTFFLEALLLLFQLFLCGIGFIRRFRTVGADNSSLVKRSCGDRLLILRHRLSLEPRIIFHQKSQKATDTR
jgi:hypothetical protein